MSYANLFAELQWKQRLVSPICTVHHCFICIPARSNSVDVQVEGLSATWARSLYSAGFTSVEKLLLSDQECIARALAVGLSRQKMKSSRGELSIGVTGSSGLNALVARDAKQILQGDPYLDWM